MFNMTEPMISAEPDIVSRCRAIVKPGKYSIFPITSRVTSNFPIWRGTIVRVMAAPQLGARFVECELFVDPGGGTFAAIEEELEQFVFVLEGSIALQTKGETWTLAVGGYTWLPPGQPFGVLNQGSSIAHLVWHRRRYQPLPGLKTPPMVMGNEKELVPVAVHTFNTKYLLPREDPAFDMAFNILHFQPGVHFTYVETHVMEHGLYLLNGRGLYWLSGDYHEVQADDFIYMAPYCPQFFYATGWETSRYLLYKDINRDYGLYL